MFLVIWGMLTMFLFRELTTNLSPGLHWVNADLLNQRDTTLALRLCVLITLVKLTKLIFHFC